MTCLIELEQDVNSAQCIMHLCCEAKLHHTSTPKPSIVEIAMSGYVLQHTAHKESLRPMEPVQTFAGNTRGPFSCQTQSHTASLAPQNGISKAKKGISRRSESKLSRPSQESSCMASKESPSVAVINGRSASSDKGPTRGSHTYER